MDMHARSLEHSPQHIETYAPTHSFCNYMQYVHTERHFMSYVSGSRVLLPHTFFERLHSFILVHYSCYRRDPYRVETFKLLRTQLITCMLCTLLASFNCRIHMYIFVYTSMCTHITDSGVSQHFSSRKRGQEQQMEAGEQAPFAEVTRVLVIGRSGVSRSDVASAFDKLY